MQAPDWSSLSAHAFGQPFRRYHARAISGGDIHQAWLLESELGAFFVKRNHARHAELLTTEAECLSHLNASGVVRCPQVLHCTQDNQQACLWLEYLPMRQQGDAFKRGQQLAQLHRQTHPQFGWHQPNYIGYTPQLNTPHDNWIAFYRECRLRPQFALAQQRHAPTRLMQLGEQLMAKLDYWFDNYQPVPSLLHGDLWSGNSAYDQQGEPLFFDPACYYGDRETDLAMSELFGGFEDAFYRGYQTEWPLDVGYAQRKPLYQLYHILNHFTLFGGHYAEQAQRVCEQLVDALR
ncbi:MAG: fructosamine kinase family protein [Thiomicrospira sp.]